MNSNLNVNIRYATLDDVERVAPLFDAYRCFYGEKPNLTNAMQFLRERFFRGESQVIVATALDEVIGFTQLFPSFSSVTMQRLWILNDLYVVARFRGQGVGEKLLRAAANFGYLSGAKQLFIEGAVANTKARGLYERFGFIRNAEYYYYHYPLHHPETPSSREHDTVTVKETV